MTASSNPQSSIVFLVDGLRPTMLGPYGNTWFDTPGFNRLASESLILEQCLADSPDASRRLRSIVHGKHVLDQAGDGPHLASVIGSAETQTVLITCARDLTPRCVEPFDEIIEVDLPPANEPAANLESTRMAAYFAAAVDVIRDQRPATALVLDCPEFNECWDAPYEYRLKLADPEDPTPSDICEVPSMQYNATTDDPDQLLDLQLACGGQTMLFDQLLMILLSEIDRSSWANEALFCVTATRGFPLGEHGVVGLYRPLLHMEALHVPMLIRWPERQRVFARSQQLVQPGSLFQLLSEWHGAEVEGEQRIPVFPDIATTWIRPAYSKSALIAACQSNQDDQVAIQTHAWKYIRGPAARLYVRPDDYWEFNDLARRCPEVMKALDDQLQEAIDAMRRGVYHEFDLPGELAFGLE